MFESWESLFDGWANAGHHDDVGEAHVPHDRPPHQPSSLVLSSNVGGHKQGHTIRVWYLCQLTPPSTDYKVYEESQDKSHLLVGLKIE